MVEILNHLVTSYRASAYCMSLRNRPEYVWAWLRCCGRHVFVLLLTLTPYRHNYEDAAKKSIYYYIAGLLDIVPYLQACGLLHVIQIFRRELILYWVPRHLLWPKMDSNFLNRYSYDCARKPATLEPNEPTSPTLTRNYFGRKTDIQTDRG